MRGNAEEKRKEKTHMTYNAENKTITVSAPKADLPKIYQPELTLN